MQGAQVRLRYAGLVSFFSTLFSTITGFLFVTMITRKLDPLEFGLWHVVFTTIAYLTVVTDIVAYWTPRFIARGENVARSCFVFNLIGGSIASLVYILVSQIVSSSLNLPFFYFLASTPHIFLIYLSLALEGISKGYAPQYTGYALIVFEITKVLLAYYFIMTIRDRLLGAILSVMIAQLIKVLYLLIVTYSRLIYGGLHKDHILRFLKLSWIPLYRNLAYFLGSIDVYMVTYFTASTLLVAYFRAAQALAVIVSYSATFSTSLYPRVLALRRASDVEETIRLTTIFAIPMAAGLIIMSKPILCVFGVKYLSAYNALIVLTIGSLITAYGGIFETTALGSEVVDMNRRATFREYLKSSLFLVPTARYLAHIGYLLSLLAILLYKPSEILLMWAIVLILSKIILVLWEYRYSKKFIKYNIPVEIIVKSFIASTVMGTLLILLSAHEIVEIRIYDLLHKLVPYVTIAALTYFIILLLIDSYSRNLVRRVFAYLRMKA